MKITRKINLIYYSVFIYLLLEDMAKKYVYSHTDKLVELLNEYAPDYCKDYPDDVIMDAIVISKRFWFIERLVKNDKIDIYKLMATEWCPTNWWGRETEWYSNLERLLMVLSIQDQPIEYLCSILKE